MPVAAIPLIAAGVGAAGSIAGGLIGSSAAGKAADAQTQAANNAANLERQTATDSLNFNKLQYGNSLNLLAPYYNSGVAANSRLSYLMGLTPNQGLPAGVINPNAPQTSTLNGGNIDPSALEQLRTLRAGPGAITPGGNRLTPFMGAQSFGGGGPINAGINPGGQNFSGGPTPSGQTITGGPSGIMSFGGGPNNAGIGPGGNPVATANGGPAQVPRTDGGENPSAPASDGSVPGGSFGSLAQGWNQTFQSPTDVTEQNDPGYQFRLQQGQQALQNSAAARGGLLSGGTAKALTDYNQNAASGEYGNVYNRALQNYNTNYNTFTNDQTNLFNRLASLSGQGQTSANNLSSAGVSAAGLNASISGNAANQIGQQLNNAGAATGSGYVGSANAINGAIGGVTNSLSTLALLRQLQGGNTNTGLGGGFDPGSIGFCWIAEELYGVDSPKTHAIRGWLKNEYSKTPVGEHFVSWYMEHGASMAEKIKHDPDLRHQFQSLFDRFAVFAMPDPEVDYESLEYQR